MTAIRHITSTLLAVFLISAGVLSPHIAQAQSAENDCTAPDFSITSNDQVYALTGEYFSYYVVTENDTSYQLDSQLPAGLNFSNGQISGTPQVGAAGDYAIDFVASNDCGDTVETISLIVVDSESSMAQTDDSDQAAAADESVSLNEIPETGVVADTALTVGFYLLALLLIAAWFSRRLRMAVVNFSGSDNTAGNINAIPSHDKRYVDTSTTSRSRSRQPRRFGDGMRR